MSTLNVMLQVRKTEQEADEIRKSAMAQARDILKGIEGASAQEERQASQEVRAKVAAYLQQEDAKIDQDVKAILQQQRAKLTQEKQAANAMLGQAADLICERIRNYGNR